MTNNIRFRPTTRVRALAASATVLLSLGLAACSSSSSTSGASPDSGTSTGGVTKVSMAEDLFSMSNASLYVAIKEGYFTAAGLDVSLDTLSSGSTMGEVMDSGKVDVAASATFEMAPLIVAGAPLLAFYSAINVTTEFCAANSFIAAHHLSTSSSLAQIASAFKGATIGISGVNSTPDLVGRYFFTTYGHLNPNSDMKIVALGSQPAVVTALENGQVNGFFASPPTCSSAVASGKATRLLTPDQVPAFKSTPQNIMYTTKSYAAAHPAVLKDISIAMAKAVAFTKANPSQVVTILKGYLPTIATATLSKELNDVIIPAIPASADMDAQGWQGVSNIVMPETSKALDTSQGTIWTNQYIPSS